MAHDLKAQFMTDEQGKIVRSPEGYLLTVEGEIALNDDGSPRKNLPGPGRPVNSKSVYSKAPTVFSVSLKKKFISLISKGYSATSAAGACDISRHTYYQALRKDSRFKEAVEVAKTKYLASLEEEFNNRIKNGSSTTTYDGEGNVITKVVKQNDNLLVKALESEDPEKYGKKQTNTSVNVNVGDSGNSAVGKLAAALGVNLDKIEQQSKEIEINGEWETKE